MKKTLATVAILLAGSELVSAQCDKKIIMTSSKTEYLDSGFVIQHTAEEKTIIEITTTTINVVAGGESKMAGTIKSKDCKWEIPYKKGKMVLKTNVTSGNGESKDVTVTIEGKEGKLTFLAEPDDRPNLKIRVTLETFEEVAR